MNKSITNRTTKFGMNLSLEENRYYHIFYINKLTTSIAWDLLIIKIKN